MNITLKFNVPVFVHYLKSQTKYIHHKSLSSKDIRKLFLDFFKNKYDHTFVPSSSVLSKNDPSLIFINSGMNQFKSIFLGSVNANSPLAKYKRVVNNQKCVRVGGKHNDLDEVGKDVYHHTFFEMLGNWSFGDYGKFEACQMAWELLTEGYCIPPERLYVTYFGGDSHLNLQPDLECRDIWLRLGIPAERILPFGVKDNFWNMGVTGPCGPCTEIHYSHTDNKNAIQKVNQGTSDVVEIWNLVFMQYDRKADGSLRLLPNQHVDTGMGLERLTAVLQGTISNYDTDLFQNIFSTIQQLLNIRPYQGTVGKEDIHGIDSAYRILADHARMFTISISDGLLPSAFHAGYVLKKIIRKAVLCAKTVCDAPPGFLSSLVYPVVKSLEDAFPEISQNVNQIVEIINVEEDKFLSLINRGSAKLHEAINNLQENKIISGSILWELHRLDGFPEELMLNIISERGVNADIAEWKSLLAKDKSEESSNVFESDLKLDAVLISDLKMKGIPITDDSSKYNYHSSNGSYVFPKLQSKLVALLQKQNFVESINIDEECGIILDKTLFYSRAGGQEADRGYIKGKNFRFQVTDVCTYGDYVLHIGFLENGSLTVTSDVTLELDEDHRLGCMRNHSATHLLNYALRQHLGKVNQEGSFINSEKLSFDFSSLETFSNQELWEIEKRVQEIIQDSADIKIQNMPLQQALKITNVITLADKTYPEVARVVSVIARDQQYTFHELCCGTHVHSSADIKYFIFTSLKGAHKGIKKLAAVTGPVAEEAVFQGQELQMDIKNLEQRIALQSVQGNLKQMQVINRALFEKNLPLKHCIDLKESAARLESQVKSLNKKLIKALKVKFSEEVEILSKNISFQPYIIHGFQTEGNDSMLFKWVKNFNVPAFAFIRAPGSKIVYARCYVPQEYVSDKFKAEDWAASIRKILCGGRGGSDHLDPKNHFVIHGTAIDNVGLAIEEAKIFAEKNLSKTTSVQLPNT